VQVHEVVYNPALQIVLYLIDDDLLPHINQLDIGQIALILVNGLVHFLVVAYPVPEVCRSLLWILSNIVR
jgi:hypothetical protein